jgi:(2Fe-2S) ferredoxin
MQIPALAYHCAFGDQLFFHDLTMTDKPYYKHHVFFCMNQRDDGRPCCAERGAQQAQQHAKRRIKALDMNGHEKVRINQAGCLDRCEEGPVLVVYPEGVWYTYVDTSDIDDIIDSHLINGKVVDRLKI